MRFVFPYTGRIGATRRKPTITLDVSPTGRNTKPLRIVAIADTGSARIVLREDLADALGIDLDSLPQWFGRGADGGRIQGRVGRIRLALDDGKGSCGEWTPEVVFANVRRNLFGFREGQEFFDCHFYNGREELVMDLRSGAPVST